MPTPAAGRTRLTRTEARAGAVAALLALILAPFVLAGFRLALDFLLVLVGVVALTTLAGLIARLTDSRAAVVASCAACGVAALAALLVFPTFQVVGDEVVNEAWANLARGVGFGAPAAAGIAASRFGPRPRRPRRDSPPGAP